MCSKSLINVSKGSAYNYLTFWFKMKQKKKKKYRTEQARLYKLQYKEDCFLHFIVGLAVFVSVGMMFDNEHKIPFWIHNTCWEFDKYKCQ